MTQQSQKWQEIARRAQELFCNGNKYRIYNHNHKIVDKLPNHMKLVINVKDLPIMVSL